MCRLCKSILIKSDRLTKTNYKRDCDCKEFCKFNVYIEDFKRDKSLIKIYEFWKIKK